MLRSVNWYLVKDVSGQPIDSIFKCPSSWSVSSLKMGSTGCLETVATSYQSVLRNIIEERRPELKLASSDKIPYYVKFHQNPRSSSPPSCNTEMSMICICVLITSNVLTRHMPSSLFLEFVPQTFRLQRLHVDCHRKRTRWIHNDLYTAASTSQGTLIHDSRLIDIFMFNIR
jgi:hypothetical protein